MNGVFRLKKKRRLLTVLTCTLLLCAVLVTVNFIPTWNLKTSGMSEFKGSNVTVYYEKEKAAATDVFELADSKAPELETKLGLPQSKDATIYIYDHQSTMQTKKYGYIAPLLGLDWYIGDNIGTRVILTSPANPGKAHTYDGNKEAVLHEMVHAYVSILNPHIHLWLTEGMALYMSNGEPFYKAYLQNHRLPSHQDLQTRNPVRFSDMGGYQLAPTYIQFINNKYGWDKVLQLIKTEDYQKAFGKSDNEIYTEWIKYLKNYYQ
jgi:hypothetical protein